MRLSSLLPSWPQTLIQDQCYSVRNQAPELEDRDGEKNEAPTIQEVMVSNLLYHLDTHRSVGVRWFSSRGTEEAGGSAHWATLHLLPEVLSNLGDHRWLVGGKFSVHLQDESKGGHLQDESKGGQGELQVSQSGADHSKCCHMTTRALGPASGGLWKADPVVRPTWSLSMTRWTD